MKRTLKTGTVEKAHCNSCGIATPHKLKSSSLCEEYDVQYEGTEFETLYWWEEREYRFWVCELCGTAALEVNYSDLNIDAHLADAGKNGISSWYPSRAKLTPKRFLPFRTKPLRNIYAEVINSYNSGLNVLCASGLRALLEGICVDMGIEDKGRTRPLTGKLYALVERNLVREEIVDNLFALKFIGDSAIHQLETPTEEELRIGAEVVESLVSLLYKESERRLSSRAAALAEKRPDEVEEQKGKKSKRK